MTVYGSTNEFRSFLRRSLVPWDDVIRVLFSRSVWVKIDHEWVDVKIEARMGHCYPDTCLSDELLKMIIDADLFIGPKDPVRSKVLAWCLRPCLSLLFNGGATHDMADPRHHDHMDIGGAIAI